MVLEELNTIWYLLSHNSIEIMNLFMVQEKLDKIQYSPILIRAHLIPRAPLDKYFHLWE